MSLWFDVARIAATLNVAFLLVLGYIWGRNYVELRSKHAFGLLMFSVFLLAENAFSLYIYLVDPALSGWFASDVPAIAWRSMMALHVFEALGLGFLLWVTWD